MHDLVWVSRAILEANHITNSLGGCRIQPKVASEFSEKPRLQAFHSTIDKDDVRCDGECTRPQGPR